MQSLGQLLSDIENEARLGGVSVDRTVYEAAGRSPETPILYAGDRNARVAFLGRDLGREEVVCGEPLVGGAGRKVRLSVCRHFIEEYPSADRESLRRSLEYTLLTNMVPYKPVENKVFPRSVRERFRPYVARFLVRHWHGNCIIPLGTEAFHWFAPYAERGEVKSFWGRDDRFDACLMCRVHCTEDGTEFGKTISVMPLPHPSPLNRKYVSVFPELLERRLGSLERK